MKPRDGLCLELHDPADHHRVINLWLLHRTATAAVLAVLRREAGAAARPHPTAHTTPPPIRSIPHPHPLRSPPLPRPRPHAPAPPPASAHARPTPSPARTTPPRPLTHTAHPPHRTKSRRARSGTAGDVCPQARQGRPRDGLGLVRLRQGRDNWHCRADGPRHDCHPCREKANMGPAARGLPGGGDPDPGTAGERTHVIPASIFGMASREGGWASHLGVVSHLERVK